jgi:hypothetical protein
VVFFNSENYDLILRVSRRLEVKWVSGVAKSRSLVKVRQNREGGLYHRKREVGQSFGESLATFARALEKAGERRGGPSDCRSRWWLQWTSISNGPW